MDTIKSINESKSLLTSPSKRIKTSRKFQELAAELMTINDKTNALKLYNRSIAVSPTNFVDLPIAYANKSAVLLEMKNYYSCLRNINFALKHPLCPLWIISALLERRVKCLLLMGRWNEHTEKKLFRAIKRLPFSANEKNLLKVRLNQYLIHVYELIKNTEDRKFKIDKYADTYEKPRRSASANDNILHFSQRIQIVQNLKCGRHIIAKNDISMGDLLVKEKAVISCLYSSEVYDYCSCCLIRTQVLIPCQHCSRTLFCSKHCLNTAKNQYHLIECPLMEYFATLEPDDQHIQYVLRLLCFLSNQGKNLTEFVDKWKEWKCKDKTYPNKTKIYDLPDDLPTLFLSYDKHVREPLQQVRSQSRYSRLVHMLRNKTDFFTRAGSNAYEAYFDYTITNLLVDLEACLKCNSFCVSDSVRSNNKLTITRKNIGLACYRKTNFYNHSCVPNVAYCFENGDTVATYSLRNIQAGEQLCICYLRTYYEVSSSERDLLKSYSFQCRCVACRENWPPFEYLQSIYDTRFCECEHHDALSRRVSITGCSFCRFKRDLAASLKTVRDRLTSNMPFDNVIENLRLDIVEAMDLFQSLAGIEVHLMREYVELYRLYGRCIETAGSGSLVSA